MQAYFVNIIGLVVSLYPRHNCHDSQYGGSKMSTRQMLLGARIKELRKRSGQSQDQLAEKAFGVRLPRCQAFGVRLPRWQVDLTLLTIN